MKLRTGYYVAKLKRIKYDKVAPKKEVVWVKVGARGDVAVYQCGDEYWRYEDDFKFYRRVRL